MPKLVLHVGTPMTGARAIQAAFARRRAQLRTHGVCYPDAAAVFARDEHSHRPFADALVGTDALQAALARDFADRLRQEAAADDTVVLSAESIHRHVDGVDSWLRVRDVGERWERKRAYLHNLAEALSGFDVHVLVVVRRPDRFVEDFYAELLARTGSTQPFHRWCAPRAWLCDHSAHVEALTSVFSRVSVLRHEDAGGSPARAVFDWLGLDGLGVGGPGVDGPAEAPPDPVLPDVRVLLWLRLAQPGTRSERWAFACSAQAARLFDGEAPATLWASLDERVAFLRRFAGAYGQAFFDAPTDNGVVAELDDAVGARIAEGWQRWRRRARAQALLLDGEAAGASARPRAGGPGRQPASRPRGLGPQPVDEPNARPDKHQRRFAVIERFLQPGSIGAELGTFKGGFLDQLLSVGPERLYAVDPWYRHTPRWPWARGDQSTVNALTAILAAFKDEIDAGVLVPRVEFSTEFLSSLPDGALDWVYVDSTHGYEQTRRELALCRRKVKPSGYLIGDDYQPDPAHAHYGVWRAVQEAVRAGELELVVDGEAAQFVAALR